LLDSHYSLAFLLAGRDVNGARSALPDAPTITDQDQPLFQWSRNLRARIATALHRAAWAFESADNKR
jgi:hypothetical protein